MSEGVHVDHVRAPPDWEILFVDGEKAYSNHTVGARDVLRALDGKTIASWESHEVTEVPKRGEVPIDDAVADVLYGGDDD